MRAWPFLGLSWQHRSSPHRAEPSEWSPMRRMLRDFDCVKEVGRERQENGKCVKNHTHVICYSSSTLWRNRFWFNLKSSLSKLNINRLQFLDYFGEVLFWVVFPNSGRELLESLLTSTDDRNTVPKRDWTQLPNHRGHLTHAQWTCQTGFQYGRHPETPAHSWHNSDALQPRGPG